MNKKKIDKLVLISYKNNFLDQKKVKKISGLINKSDLKKYINGLRVMEKKRSLVVSSPFDIPDSDRFQKLFPNKKIVFKKDSKLMLGIEIVDNDTVYEFTLKNSFDKIISHIEQNYD